MKNITKKILMATMALTVATTSIPATAALNPTGTVSVQAAEKNGLYHEGSDWNYYKNGRVSTDTTLVKYNGSWWYVKNGKIDFSARTLCKYNGTWWYVKDGKVNFGARTLCKYNGTWWYVSGGKVDFSAETVVKYNGSWWYVKDGKVNFGARTLCKYNGTWWFIENGRIQWNGESIVQYGGTWYYVKNGQVDWNSGETLCRYDGAYKGPTTEEMPYNKKDYCALHEPISNWYSEDGTYNGSWWHIKDGRVKFDTTLVRYNGTWYYVHNGIVDWGTYLHKNPRPVYREIVGTDSNGNDIYNVNHNCYSNFTLCYYNGNWWVINKGTVAFDKFIGKVRYGDRVYMEYAEGNEFLPIIDFNYFGFQNGSTQEENLYHSTIRMYK